MFSIRQRALAEVFGTAALVLVGTIAVAPALGWGLVIAALLIALWVSDRKRRQPRWPAGRNR